MEHPGHVPDAGVFQLVMKCRLVQLQWMKRKLPHIYQLHVPCPCRPTELAGILEPAMETKLKQPRLNVL